MCHADASLSQSLRVEAIAVEFDQLKTTTDGSIEAKSQFKDILKVAHSKLILIFINQIREKKLINPTPGSVITRDFLPFFGIYKCVGKAPENKICLLETFDPFFPFISVKGIHLKNKYMGV